ncbi:hypothetical protein J3R83DRAFT_6949 [Lanmaoa asiatica]|nr:hypothetical protein J3R83DRAFT_6949 [Lanmaoa asiatica]
MVQVADIIHYSTLIDSTPGVIDAWDEFRKQYTHLPSSIAHLTHGRRLMDTLREYCRITDETELEKEIVRFELLVANQRDGLGPRVLNGAQKLLNEVTIGLTGNTQARLTI